MVRFLCQFQQVDINLGPGCKNLALNRRFLTFQTARYPHIRTQYQPGMEKRGHISTGSRVRLVCSKVYWRPITLLVQS
jgi:hypothetical protein